MVPSSAESEFVNWIAWHEKKQWATSASVTHHGHGGLSRTATVCLSLGIKSQGRGKLIPCQTGCDRQSVVRSLTLCALITMHAGDVSVSDKSRTV